MKKNLFLGFLVFSLLVFPCANSFAKKAKKVNPIKAPVVIKTEPDEQDIKESPLNTNELEIQSDEILQETVDAKEVTDSIEPVESVQAVKTDETKSDAEAEEKIEPVVQIKTKETTKFVVENPCNAEIEKFFTEFAVLQNKHNINALKKIYADDFVNTDGYNKTQLFALMSRTYSDYPDLKIEYFVKNIETTKSFATAHVIQKVSATTKDVSKITKDKGTYSATLDTVVYLNKFGANWKIYSEEVLSEVSTLVYGMAKNVVAQINAPQKVLSGKDYSASVTVEMPEGYSAIASVNNTEIVEGYNMKGETFRQVPADSGTVERVFKANDLNNNEAVVVSVGFTKLTQDMFKKAKMDISGLMILMKRVDIIPENSNHKDGSSIKNENKK